MMPSPWSSDSSSESSSPGSSGSSASSGPSPSESPSRSRRARQLLDAVVYGFVVAAVVFVAGAGLGLVVGGRLVTAKFVMFVVGILLFGYSTLQMRPAPPWGTEQTEDGTVKVTKNEPKGQVVGAREETKFQAAVQRIPPLSRYSLPPDDRLSVAVKLFVASLTTLAWSFALETVFGVVA